MAPARGLVLAALAAVMVLLAASLVRLWRLLAAHPRRRRWLNMAYPTSQLLVLAVGFAVLAVHRAGAIYGALLALLGMACVASNARMFRSLLAAEDADVAAARASALEEQLAEQERLTLEAERASAEVERLRTALASRLEPLECALRAGDAAAAHAALAQARVVVPASGPSYCRNTPVNALLRVKARTASELGVSLDVQADIPVDIGEADAELCAIVSNLLDNALVACADAPAHDRSVTVRARVERGLANVLVSNPVVAESALPAGNGPRFGSESHFGNGPLAQVPRAADGMRERGAVEGGSGDPERVPRHGWGLSIVRTLTARRDGVFSLRVEGDRVVARAVLPLCHDKTFEFGRKRSNLAGSS